MAILRGYCTTGDVQRINYLRNYLENDLYSKRPNVADIEDFIDSSMDVINQILLSVGYTLPIVLVTSPYGYNWVLYWNTVCAAERVERQYGEESIADYHKEKCDSMRDDILNRVVILTDVPGAPTQTGLAESGTSELTEAGDVRVPFFTRDDLF